MSDTPMSEFERARIALGYVPPDDRDTWVKMAMALKNEFGDDGLALWHDWGSQAKGYNPKDASDVWKSVKLGKTKLATLFFEAKRHGFNPAAHKAKPVDATELERRRVQRAAREAEEQAGEATRHATAADAAQRIWAGAAPAPVDHPYLVRKRIGTGELRIHNGELVIGKVTCDGALLVPARDESDTLWTLEFILPDGQKRFLPDGRKSGCFAWIGGSVTTTILVGEGYATCATLTAATGFPSAVAFDAGNLLAVTTLLRSRYPDARIVLCADDDHQTEGNPGVTKARAAADTVGGLVAIPDFGDKRPTSATDFNDLAAHLNIEAVAANVFSALAVDGAQSGSKGKVLSIAPKPIKRPKTARTHDGKSRFEMDDKGVWYHGLNSQGEPLPRHWVCTPVDIVARTRNEENSDWGYLVEFSDADGMQKRWSVPAALFAGDGAELRRSLLEMGVEIGYTQVARTQIANYIQSSRPDLRVRCVPRVGWHNDAFVLPDRVIGEGSEPMIYQADAPIQSQFKESGTLDEWRQEVAAYCVGNSRLMFCVCTAFAAPLLHYSGMQSGGFHLVGTTSKGKSTGGVIAASVFGPKAYVRSWRATSNAMEAVAAMHSDALLILDEIGQAEPREISNVIYTLGNQQGKGRATRTGSAKPVLNWRVLVLSNGEKGVEALMAEANQKMKGGIEVRLSAVPAEAGEMGVVENLHRFPSPAALIEHLERESSRNFGTAGTAFIEWASSNANHLAENLRLRIEEMVARWVPDGAASEVSRVAKRFALVGAAGELATANGFTGWSRGDAIDAAHKCFEGWMKLRGGAGSSDETEGVRQVIHFLVAHGDNRFLLIDRAHDDHRPNVPHRAGFKQRIKRGSGADVPISTNKDYYTEFGNEMTAEDAEAVELEYLIEKEVFRKEVCAGFDHKMVAKALIKRGVLMPRTDGYPYRRERIKGHGHFMVYRILPSIFSLDV